MQTVTIPAKKYEEIVSKLEYLSQEVKGIKAQLSRRGPVYGSYEWWEWSDQKAKRDVSSGRVVKFDSAEEAIRWLNS